MTVAEQVISVFTGVKGYLDDVELNKIKKFEKDIVEKNNWKTADKKNVKNVDLWKKLKSLTKSNRVEWYWIKSHSENPMNDLADELAKKATPI